MKETNTKEALKKKIQNLNPSLRTWEIWESLMSIFSCTLANTLETNDTIRAKREEEYKRALEKIGNTQAVAETYALLMQAVEENPCTDILGELYMSLRLGNHWKGQFFSPQSLADISAMMTIPNKEDVMSVLEEKGYISIADCCGCGAGVMLLAGAKRLKEMGINYQAKALFVGQDIDRIAAQMCFVQLALNGCTGYVCVANTLTNPVVVDENGTLLIQPGQEFWFTPSYRIYELSTEEGKKTA